MGCANGLCSIAPQSIGPTGACCNECAEDDYRAMMQARMNPWAGRVARADPAFNPYDQSSYGLSGTLADFNDPTGAPKTESPGTGTGTNWGALAGGAIDQIGQTAREWIDADVQRDRNRTAADIERQRIEAGIAASNATTSTNAATDASGASGGGDNSMLLLGGLGLAAAYFGGLLGGRRR